MRRLITGRRAITVPLPPPPDEDLLTPREVGELLRVNPKTVTRWAISGRLPCVTTPGGHRRYRRSDVERLLTGGDHHAQS